MAIQPNPPIQLSPDMDEGHKTTFINQNFQSIADFLKSNSFKILTTGAITSNNLTFTPGGAGYSTSNAVTAPVAHGLNFIPTVLGVLNNSSSFIMMPFSNYILTGVGAVWFTVYLDADATNINMKLNGICNAFGAGSIATGIYTAKYYILQETAN